MLASICLHTCKYSHVLDETPRHYDEYNGDSLSDGPRTHFTPAAILSQHTPVHEGGLVGVESHVFVAALQVTVKGPPE